MIHGYRLCKTPGCENIVLHEVSYATAGRCSDCYLADNEPFRVSVEAQIEGRTSKIRLSGPQSWKNASERRRRAKPHVQAKARRLERAKRKAARRLSLLFRAEYLFLQADERAKEGLDPWTVPAALELRKLLDAQGRTPESVMTTLGDLAAYDPSDGQAPAVHAPAPEGGSAQ